MKISKIAKLCKDTKLVCMTSTEAGFWIGNGNAVYFVPEFTNMDCDGIALAFGIDEKKKEKIIFTNLDMSGFNMQDIEPSESLCEPMGINFWQEGDILRPYRTEAGVLCLVGSYLEPLRDEMEAREVYLRYTKDGKPYFAVKVGMLLYAIVMPAKGISFEFVKKLGEMYEIVTEGEEQRSLFVWATIAAGKYPALNLLFHIPNEGKRSQWTGARMRSEGLKSGVPDLCLPVARSGYHGLYIELKAGKNKPTANQLAWLEALEAQGYKTAVCYGWEAAKNVIEAYLKSGEEKK